MRESVKKRKGIPSIGLNGADSLYSAYQTSWTHFWLFRLLCRLVTASYSRPVSSSPLYPPMSHCWIDFAAGDSQAYEESLRRYDELVKWLAENGAKYGLPGKLDELDDAGRETLTAVYEGDTKVSIR